MTERIEISKLDVKDPQVITWVITSICMLILASVLFFSFTLNGVFLILVIALVFGYINYAGARMWNIWYENEFLYFENIYKTHKVSIRQFNKIEMTSIFFNGYTLFLIDNKEYQFRIKSTDDIMLLFKTDRQFYAKKMTQDLNERRQNLASDGI